MVEKEFSQMTNKEKISFLEVRIRMDKEELRTLKRIVAFDKKHPNNPAKLIDDATAKVRI